ERVEGSKHIPQLITAVYDAFDEEHPENSIDGLISLLTEVEKVKDTYWREQKIAEISELIIACGGIWFESYAPVAKYAVGEQISVTTTFIVRRPDVEVSIGKTTLTFNEPYEQPSTVAAS